MKKEKLIYWIFILQAIILFVLFGINLVIPLAVARPVSAIWIIFGIGILFIAKGVKDNKKWAPITALLGTTLPYILLPIGINIIQNYYYLVEGGFGMPLTFWLAFIINLICSLVLIYTKKK
ncbi:MAG TPA: hypothetical protein VJH65_03240 [Candidatus Nanoarchaeia archaeon]|nr:hypothetical protein [Candidatus Nanoarchaeia archaeon]